MTSILDKDLGAFRKSLDGQVVAPDDPGYDAGRSVWNGDIDRRPAAVVHCWSPADVAAAIEFGRAHGLELSVRGGGHSTSGAAVSEGGLMIHLGALNQVTVDPVARRARVGGGATLAEMDAATQAHGLAVTGGVVSHTGVGGLTLGGGMGWLHRKLGLSIDNLLACEVVLADGRIVRASAREYPDLYWALRGGGGNFGVVTEFEFELHQVGPEVHVGLFFWGLDQAAEALRLAREVVETLPRDSGGVIVAMNAPPAPPAPEQHWLAPGVALVLVGFSSADDFARLAEPVRAGLTPLFELVTPMPYVALQQMVEPGFPWGIKAYNRSLTLNELSDEAIDVLSRHLPAKCSPMTQLPVFSLGGAYADVGEDDTAFSASRSARYSLELVVMAPADDLLAADRAWMRELWDALLPFAVNSGSYVNFMYEYEEDRVRASYGAAKYDRLARIKAEYDPENLFHLNANIKPAR